MCGKFKKYYIIQNFTIKIKRAAFIFIVINRIKSVYINIFQGMVSSLQTIFETASPGFAYEVLTLEIQVENFNIGAVSAKQKQSTRLDENAILINNLSKLIQLYMLGVQILQSNSDNRYKYFSQKIQGLMKKKHIIQQLHLASTGQRANKDVLKQANQGQLVERKNQHDIQILLNSEQCNIRKIKQIVEEDAKKFKGYQKRLKADIQAQQTNLQERRRLRKLRSQNGSVHRFDLGQNPSPFINRDIMINNEQSANNRMKDLQEKEDHPRKLLKASRSTENLFMNNLRNTSKRNGSIGKKLRIIPT